MENKNRITFKWLLLVIFFGLGFNNLLAQTKVVSGTVTDAAGVALPGVSVMVKDSKKAVSTDLDGNFKIDIHEGEVLVFSYVGMETLHHKVTAKDKTLKITLKEAINELEDVVVVGYGTAKKITAITGSVAKVSGENLMNKPSASVLDALQGKVAGLSIFSTSGEPSDVATIRLHGSGSIFGRSDPLFVMDGSFVSKQVVILLNPADIESVSVLKDASATSIYGTRASNGVIYITTRRGKKGEDASVTISSQYGFSNLAGRKLFDNMMNAEEYADLLVDRGLKTREEADKLLRDNPSRVRWDRVFFKDNAPMSQLNASVMGGGRKTRYYVSGGYYDQEGLMYRSGFERYTLRANLDTEINDWLTTSFRLATGYSKYMINSNAGKVFSLEGSLSVLMAPIYSPVDENGNRYKYIPEVGLPHPHYWAENNPATSENMNLTPQLSVILTPIKGLTIKSEGGVQYMGVKYHAYSLPSFVEEYNKITLQSVKPHTNKRFSETIIKTLTNTAEYQFGLGTKHHFTLLAGQESVSIDYSSLNGATEGQTSDRSTMLRHGEQNKIITDNKSVNAFNSFFGRVDYALDGKYFADLSIRRDGSSRFGRNNRYADFWAVGLMWKLDSEEFIRKSSWIDSFNIKFSIGTSGNTDVIPEYAALQRISNSSFYKDKAGYLLYEPGNPNLQWQKQLKTSIGINLSAFKTIHLAMDIYDRRTTNMLSSVYVPSFSGIGGIIENGGELQNRGIDLNLSFNLLKRTKHNVDFTPFIAVNYNQEKIISLHEGKTSIRGDALPISYIVGQPVIYDYPIFYRINPDTGYPQWYLPGEDPMVTTTDENRTTSTFNSQALRQNTGIKRTPPLNGGFGFTAAYGNLTLQTMFAFSYGKYMINRDRFYTENPVGITGHWPDNNQNRVVFDNWKKPGDIARFPSFKHGVLFTEYDSRLIEDASYIRLKDLTLSYNFTKEFLQQIGFFKGIRVFSSGRNLLTFTKYTGLDPEFDMPISAAVNPSTKEYSFGVEFRF